MTNRVSYQPQDFDKKCKQAERDHESRKLNILLEKVRLQIASRSNAKVDSPKPPALASTDSPKPIRRTVVFER